MDRLKQTAAFMREGETGKPEGEGKEKVAPKRYLAKDLYEPTDALRNLGLPILFWSEQVKWRANSEEGKYGVRLFYFKYSVDKLAKFMFELGLNRYPPLETILMLAGSTNIDKRAIALKYFIENHNTRYTSYQAGAFKHLAFVPALKPDGTSFLANPTVVRDFPLFL